MRPKLSCKEGGVYNMKVKRTFETKRGLPFGAVSRRVIVVSILSKLFKNRVTFL